jgi:antitoxin component YwqK of YwqJK toxin-antitoxin module
MEEGQWENNRWVGEHKFYYETGKLNYVWTHNSTGKREGVQKYYHPNGKIMIEGDWKDGKENGVIKEYFEDGSLKAEKNYADGAFDAAKSKTYEPNQKTGSKEEAPVEVKKTETPVNTVKSSGVVGQIPDGFNKTFTKFGKPEKEGTFKDGKLMEGKVYIYEGTTHVRTALYKGGVKTGEEEAKK